MIDNATALAFSLYENKGVYALLLGSGLSRSAQIPTGWEITTSLVQRIAALRHAVGEPDWVNWYIREFGAEPRYSDLLDTLSSTPQERRSILHKFIDPTPEDIAQQRRVPTRAHRAIAKLVQGGFVRIILTTNFDRLIENSVREAGVEPTVVKSVDDLRGAIPIVHSKCWILKVHGDYLDARILNTEKELEKYDPEIDKILDQTLAEYGLIVCGWSGEWDIALRNAIARTPNRRYPVFWAARGEPSKAAADLISLRSAKVILIADADSFFGELAQNVTIQAEVERPNPKSTELLIGRAKKKVYSKR